MNSRIERAKKLKPRDPWFGCTFEEAPIRALRDAQFIPLSEKLRWLEEAYLIAKKKGALSSPADEQASSQ